jgi:hypothetical protein
MQRGSSKIIDGTKLRIPPQSSGIRNFVDRFFLTNQLARLITGGLLAGVLSLNVGMTRMATPHYPGASLLYTPTVNVERGYCSNGSWVFPGGKLITITYTEEAAITRETVTAWYKTRGWRPSLLRGTNVFTPGDQERSANRYWINVDLVTDVAYSQVALAPRTLLRSRYRLFVCPPSAWLEH